MTKDNTQPYALTLHFKRPPFKDMIKIQHAEDVNQYLRDRIDTGVINHKEFFWIILTTRANRILGMKEIASGSANAAHVSFREIVQTCLLANASGCVLVHNHPSGNLKPSSCDRNLTRKAGELLELFEITLIDHLIITQEDYFSFVQNDLLPSL